VAKLLSFNDAAERCGIARITIYRLIDRGAFPKPVEIADRRVAFVESEIDAWIEDRIARRDDPDVQARRAQRSEELSQRVKAAHERGAYRRAA
jgi:prophage regulatory protein